MTHEADLAELLASVATGDRGAFKAVYARQSPVWIAQADREGGIMLAAVRPAFGEPQPITPEGRVMQLWALRPGDPGPTSLALLPRTPGRINIPAPALRPVNNMRIEISLEPQGGSPTGRPTDPGPISSWKGRSP